MKMSKKLSLLVVALVCLTFTVQGASSAKGVVLGNLYDSDGTTPIQGAVVKVTNNLTGSMHESTLSSREGSFQIIGLENGIYRYSVSTPDGDFVANDVFGLKLSESDSAKIAINIASYENTAAAAVSGMPAPREIEGETFVGRIVDFNSDTRTAEVFIMQGVLQGKDKIHALGEQTDFYQNLKAVEVSDSSATIANPGDTASIILNSNAEVGDAVYVASSGKGGVLPWLLVPAGVAAISAGSAAVAYNVGTAQVNQNLCPCSGFGTNQTGTLTKTGKGNR